MTVVEPGHFGNRLQNEENMTKQIMTNTTISLVCTTNLNNNEMKTLYSL